MFLPQCVIDTVPYSCILMFVFKCILLINVFAAYVCVPDLRLYCLRWCRNRIKYNKTTKRKTRGKRDMDNGRPEPTMISEQHDDGDVRRQRRWCLSCWCCRSILYVFLRNDTVELLTRLTLRCVHVRVAAVATLSGRVWRPIVLLFDVSVLNIQIHQ